MVLAQEVVIVCLCLKDTEIHATSKQGNTTNSALESLHSLQRPLLLLLDTLAQLLSGEFVLSGRRLQLFNGAVVDDVDIFRWKNGLDSELSS